MSIKDELQGTRGLLRRLRNTYMPHGVVIAEEAIKNLRYIAEQIEKAQARRNFNSLLFDVLIEEWNVFQKYEKELYKSKVIPSIFELIERDSSEFPNCRAVVKNTSIAIEQNKNQDSKWFLTTLNQKNSQVGIL